jgi:hypothetical protein
MKAYQEKIDPQPRSSGSHSGADGATIKTSQEKIRRPK